MFPRSSSGPVCLHLVLAVLVFLATACTKDRPGVSEAFNRYSEASRSHDLETLAALTADDVIWQLGPYRVEGKEEALKPNAFDGGMQTALEYRVIRVYEDTVEFELIETNELVRAIGMREIRYYPRFVFKDGLVHRKGTGWKQPSDEYSGKEAERRKAPFRKWIRENRPEAMPKLLDADRQFIWSKEAGELMLTLTREWVAAGSPGQIPPR